MKSASYFIVLLLSIVCVVLSVSLMLTVRVNQHLQAGLQAKQQLLNIGILGPQGQQIGNNLLQDMANTATNNANMRQLLAKYGYQIQPTASSATNVIDTSNANVSAGQVEGKK